MLRIIVLGAAAGGGFPQWNCGCRGCERARAGDPKAIPRTQSSLAVSSGDGRWVLLNASPDLRQQINATPRLHPPAGTRESPIAAVVLTNGDVDHVAGLLTMREGHPFVLYATGRVQETLRRNSVFDVLAADRVRREELSLGRRFRLHGPAGEPLGLEAEAFPVPGKVALYLEDAAAGDNFGTVPEDTVALEVRAERSDARFVYVPACARMTDDVRARLAGAPLVFFDGTVWEDEEMPRLGVGSKTGRRMGHMSIAGADGSLAAFADLDVARKVYIHLNNTNPVLLDDSPERATVAAAGWEVAWDGMEITL